MPDVSAANSSEQAHKTAIVDVPQALFDCAEAIARHQDKQRRAASRLSAGLEDVVAPNETFQAFSQFEFRHDKCCKEIKPGLCEQERQLQAILLEQIHAQQLFAPIKGSQAFLV